MLLALVLAAMVLVHSLNGPEVVTVPSGSMDAGQPTGQTVSLVIDFGDGRTLRYDELPWHDGMTAEQLLAAARRAGSSSTPAKGGLRYAQQGSGESALLMQIDGVANEGAAGRNWVFFVNDRVSQRGFGAYVLRPGDRVLWRFVPSQ